MNQLIYNFILGKAQMYLEEKQCTNVSIFNIIKKITYFQETLAC